MSRGSAFNLPNLLRTEFLQVKYNGEFIFVVLLTSYLKNLKYMSPVFVACIIQEGVCVVVAVLFC